MRALRVEGGIRRLIGHAVTLVLSVFLLLLPPALTSCSKAEQKPPARKRIPVYGVKVINTYPHDPAAFTEGLVISDGVMYESTGQKGKSSLRRVGLTTGEILQIRNLPDTLFGEGLTAVDDRLIQLTWLSHIGMVYERASFNLLKQFSYLTEGWGLTYDGTHVIMSDGTSTLQLLDPETLEYVGSIEVRANGGPAGRLNELEYVKGEILANLWPTSQIARIDARTGEVTGWIDGSGLLSNADYQRQVDVLNGIAYDAGTDKLYVTGKYWPKLFEIELVER